MTRAQAGGPGGWPTLMCQVLTPRTRDQGAADLIVMSWDDPDPAYPGSGVPAAAVLAGRDPGQDLQAPEPSWPPTLAWHQ